MPFDFLNAPTLPLNDFRDKSAACILFWEQFNFYPIYPIIFLKHSISYK